MRVHTTHRTRRARRGEATTEDQQDCMSADSRRPELMDAPRTVGAGLPG
ncbi:unnamed protein product [Prorocentrum cordatum]|uniref:Uncharacterized protein n=1 Tax=Prorocentrum cordatum TaxID=2364126 RepID=A0ABN9S689_9DINO|nr:unnamed protein product [Polarella glacialis]